MPDQYGNLLPSDPGFDPYTSKQIPWEQTEAFAYQKARSDALNASAADVRATEGTPGADAALANASKVAMANPPTPGLNALMRSTQAATAGDAGNGIPSDTGSSGFRLRLKKGNQYLFSNKIGDIDWLLNNGWQAIGDNGSPLNVQKLPNGGTVIDGLPLNAVLGGTIQQDQVDYLKQNNIWNSQWDSMPVAQMGDQSGSTTGNGDVRYVKMPNGEMKIFTGIDTDLDAALKAGGIPIDPTDGSAMKVTPNVYGGYLVTNAKGEAMPLNVYFGQGWQPGQQNVLQNYMMAGWTPGQPALPPETAPSISSETNIDPNLFGSLMEPWTKEFKHATVEEARNAPGSQLRFDEAMKALERPFAASGMKSGGQLKALQERGMQLGDTFYNEEDQRKLADYERDYNVFENNQNKRFSRLFSIVSGVGMPTQNNLNTAGANFANNASNLSLNGGLTQAGAIQNAGAARASGYINSANSTTGGINTGLQTFSQLLAATAKK